MKKPIDLSVMARSAFSDSRVSASQLGLLIIAVYVGICAWAGTHLTFFWDDIDVVLSQGQDGFLGLFHGSGQHWGPFGRAIFQVETWFFGEQYFLYVATNALLLGLAAWLFLKSAGVFRSPVPAMGSLLLTIFLFAPGVMATAFIASTSAWQVSLIFAGLAALSVAREQPQWRWMTFLAASYFTLTSFAVLNAVLFSCSMWIAGAQRSQSLRHRIITVLAVVGSSLLVAVAGNAIGARNPTAIYENSSVSNSIVEGLMHFKELSDAIQSWLTTLLVWTVAPIIPMLLVWKDELTGLLLQYSKLGFVLAVPIIAIIALVVLQMFRRKNLFLQLLLVAFIGVAVINGAIVLGRPQTFYNIRYEVFWLLGAILFWAQYTSARLKRGWSIPQTVVRVMVAVSACCIVLSLPLTLQHATDLDRPRWSQSNVQIEFTRTCGHSLGATSFKDLSGAFTGEDVCAMLRYLRSSSPFPWA